MSRKGQDMPRFDGFTIFIPSGWIGFDLARPLDPQVDEWLAGLLVGFNVRLRNTLRQELAGQIGPFLAGFRDRDGAALLLPGTPLVDQVSPMLAVRRLTAEEGAGTLDMLVALAATEPSATIIEGEGWVGLRTVTSVDLPESAGPDAVLASSLLAAGGILEGSLVRERAVHRAHHARYVLGRPDRADRWLDVLASVTFTDDGAEAAEEALDLFDTLVRSVSLDGPDRKSDPPLG